MMGVAVVAGAAGLAQQADAAAPAGRAYEMVSPPNKNGASAGTGNLLYNATPGVARAAADGDRIIYYSSGAFGDGGDGDRGLQDFTTSTRSATGWRSRASIAAPDLDLPVSIARFQPHRAVLAADASRIAFLSSSSLGEPNPVTEDTQASPGLYLAAPGARPTWISQPTSSDPSPAPGTFGTEQQMYPLGGSSDLTTTYFSYCGERLTAADDAREPGLASGVYEWRNGALSNAGVLPDGSIDPEGAAQAGNNVQCTSVPFYPPDQTGNQVSAQGDRIMFVSPDPWVADARPVELYTRVQGANGTLVSRSEVSGDASAAGVMPIKGTAGEINRQYAMASSNGQHIVFRSTDALTSDAPVGPTPKTYEYDVATQDLRYLDGVSGSILHVTANGASVVFLADGELSVWRDGDVVDLGAVSADQTEEPITALRSTADEGYIVFQSSRPLGGEPRHPEGTTQVYGYRLGSTSLNCISCAPEGAATTDGSGYVSNYSQGRGAVDNQTQLNDSRNVTADGQVFFDTTAEFSTADTNGRRDVYSFKDGKYELVTSGKDDRDSFLIDTDTTGDNVFFATAEGLVEGDTDGVYDVYDARVGGGIAVPPGRTPCGGDDCQRPVTPGSREPAPASTSTGTGNVSPTPTETQATRKVRLRSVKSSTDRVAVRLVAPSAGRVTVSGKGVASARRNVSKKGAYVVKVKLSKRTVQDVRRAGKKRLRIRVVFKPAKGGSSSASAVVTIRKAGR